MESVVAARAKLSAGLADSELLAMRRRHPTLIVQLVTLKEIPGSQTINMIGQQTLRAMKTGALLAAKPEVDLLLRLAGTTQIALAIEEAGYRARGAMLLVAAGSARGVSGLRKELVGNPTYEIVERGGMDEKGLAMVERAALLGTRS